MFRLPSALSVALLSCMSLPLHAAFTPTIRGTVTLDDGVAAVPQPVVDMSIGLYLDDGDGVLNPSGDTLIGTTTTDGGGGYLFENLDANSGYFVQRAISAPGISNIASSTTVSTLIQPGDLDLVIDLFQETQIVAAGDGQASLQAMSTQLGSTSEMIGGERDILAERTIGVGDITFSVNPFGIDPAITFDTTAGAGGRGIVTWDGVDGQADEVPSMGLGGIDLTAGGTLEAVQLRLGIDSAGAGESVTIRIFEGDSSTFSDVTIPIPLTDGSASELVSVDLADFSGPASTSNVDAIQLILENTLLSTDSQFAELGVVGAKVFDFALSSIPENPVPEPCTLLLLAAAIALCPNIVRRAASVTRPSRPAE